MAEQLIKKTEEGHSNVMPKSWIEAITDKSTGESLTHILQGFNMYFLSYTGNTEQTRCQVPKILRKKGLWITYVKYDGNVYTEWYNSNNIDDKSWGNSSNWRIGNNELVGDLTISANGNWVINGNETEFKAIGEKGNTPLIRIADNKLQVSYDRGDTYNNVSDNPVYTQIRTYNNKLQISTDLGANWIDASDEIAAYFRFNSGQGNNVGNIQISRNNKDWSNLSGNFVNNLHISKYIGADETLPTSGIAEGTIYAKGPTYADSDTSHNNPIYRLWVYAYKGNTLAWQDNGEFTSINVGITQELGNSENLVVSQKCVSQEIIQGGVYDVSAHNNNAVFESLQTLLSSSNLSTLIPSSVRHGGMSIKFIQGSVPSSDNKYVQYRLMSDTWNTKPVNWQGVDEIPTTDSHSLVESGGVINCLNNNELLPIEAMPVYKGWLDSSNTIIDYKNSKYIVVEVQGGETFSKSYLKDCYVMILKSFTYNPSLPYTPDFATGEMGRRTGDINKFTLPVDAKYILMSVSQYNNLLIPEVFELDGVNLVNTIRENISNWVNTDVNWNDAQKKQARKNLGFGNGDIDEYPIYDSQNLVRSGGVVNSLVNEKLLSINKKQRFSGWIDSSNKIISHANGQYIVIEVEGGEKLTKSYLSNNYVVILKTFTYNPTLPYTLDFATGETGRRNGIKELTLPSDARYVLMSIRNGNNILIPEVFEINGVNLSKNLVDNVSEIKTELNNYEVDTDFKIGGISTLKTYLGWLDSSNKIIDYQGSRYSVIKVKGGDIVTKSRISYGNVVILKSFTFNPTLPYSLDFAQGETIHDCLNNYVLPDDARYMLFTTEKNRVSTLPQIFTINNEDVLKSSKRIIGDFKYPLTEISKIIKSSGHLDGSGSIISWGYSRYIVVPIQPGDKLYLESYTPDDTHETSSIALVTAFDFNSAKTLPYALSFCSDYSSIIDVRPESLGGLNITVPQDAKYLVCRALGNTGNKIRLPKRIVINGKYDLSISMKDNITKNIILPNVFNQKNDLKINRIFSGFPGYQGMCTIDGILCSGTKNAMYIKDSEDVLFGTKSKALGITTHTNDIDYCEYSNTLITAVIQPEDGEHMQICLLQNAKEKLQSDTALTEQDWLRITLSEFDDSYIMVGNCFGESCDIVYAVLIDKTNNYYNKNKRILKIKLGYQSGVYDGTFEILKNVAFPHILEIQGSKYLNGYLFISTDGKINTGNNLHSSVTVVDLETMKTTEHISYENQDEKNKNVEAEGLSFLNNKMYQIVIVRTNNTTVLQLREFNIFNLQN